MKTRSASLALVVDLLQGSSFGSFVTVRVRVIREGVIATTVLLQPLPVIVVTGMVGMGLVAVAIHVCVNLMVEMIV